MTPKQFESEMNYLVARHLAECFLKQGFMTKTEFRKIDDFLVRTFSPLIGKLLTLSLDKSGDKSELEQKQQALLTEMQTLDSALRQLFQQNATTVQDQSEYRKSYDEITQKFSKAEEQKKLVDQKLSNLLEHRGIIENFIKKLNEQNGQISEFSENLWCGLLDYVTAYADGRLVFRFKNGSEFEG